MASGDITVTLRAAKAPLSFRTGSPGERVKKFSHPDGGIYVIYDDNSHQMKMDDGRWEPSVAYRRVTKIAGRWAYEGRNIFHTTKARWAERFTELPDEPGR